MLYTCQPDWETTRQPLSAGSPQVHLVCCSQLGHLVNLHLLPSSHFQPALDLCWQPPVHTALLASLASSVTMRPSSEDVMLLSWPPSAWQANLAAAQGIWAWERW